MNAVDTNILVYSLDIKEPVKYAKARHLLNQLVSGSPATVLLWQVLGEFVRQLRRWQNLGVITDAELLTHVGSVRGMFPLQLPTEPVLDRALDLAGRYSLSHWDSMLLGACVEAGVTTLYTEDMGAPRTIDTIQLVNPLI